MSSVWVYTCSLPVELLKTVICISLRLLIPCSWETWQKNQPNTVTSTSTLRFTVFSQFFVTIVCFPMDSLVRPELFLLLLEQEDRSLEDHTRLFLLLANATTYPDDALCAFCPKHCFPNMVLERLLPPSWSGLWQETDCPSLSALVGRRPAIASGLLSPGCASSIHPTGSVGLLPPVSSTWVLSHSGSTVDLQISASTLVARALGSTLAPRIHSIPLARWLSFSTSGSSTTCSTAVGQLPGVGSHPLSMAPPSVGSTVDHHHVCQPPPGGSSFSWVTSVVPTRPSPCCYYGARTHLPGGGVMSGFWIVLFCSPCVPWPSLSPVWLVWFLVDSPHLSASSLG